MKKIFPVVFIICIVLLMGDSLFAARYQITIISAKINQTKPDGKKWDVWNVPPDPYVKILVNDDIQGQTSVKKDTYNPYWDREFTINYNNGDSFSIEVIDEDIRYDDIIGVLHAEKLEEGEGELRFGSVKSLRIKIRRR